MNIEDLKALALNVYWSSDTLWQKIDPVLWELTHNPWVILQTASREKLEKFSPEFEALLKENRERQEAKGWFQTHHSKSPLKTVAYFCMEFMLSEALPIYSGGLGNVAGDQLKAASDLGVPVVGVGLLYQQGYFRQMIDKQGYQQALFPYNDPGQLPISPVRKENGEWLRLEIALPGWSLWIRAWEVQVGRLKLYLLDSNDPANYPAHRGITSELYGGNSELRLKQELLLGIGGWRLLQALDIHPDVCHLNEGHAAFAILERAKNYMSAHNVSFYEALATTRAGNLFTTHTPVPAGFDRFSPELIEQYLGNYAKNFLGISIEELLALGRLHPQEPFNMAYLAIRGSGAVNGVSELHGQVSRKIFEPLFPRWPEQEVPIGYVTNGVHMPTWDAPDADKTWTEACGKDRWLGTTEKLEEEMKKVSDQRLWQMKNAGREALVKYVRQRFSGQLASQGAPKEAVEKARHAFDPHTLTLGFARRFATYKRPNLLLHQQERLLHLLTDLKHPVQLVVAGKAHPADQPGQALVHEWMNFIHDHPNARIVFLSDYDISLTQQMVQGVDVWINTPRRPWEACGTSGMKVLVNGGLNLSELDGWWAEAYRPEVGWALGDGQEHDDDPLWDAKEADDLYAILEKQIVPEFYERDSQGLPIRWIEKIRESMATLTPRFSANRSVREYTEKYYLPLATRYLKRDGHKILEWEKKLAADWDKLRFCAVKVETVGDHHAFEAHVYLNDFGPEEVKVQLYAEGALIEMKLLKALPDFHIYKASILANRPSSDYTVRVIPSFPDVQVPLEAHQILWQK